MLVSAAADAFFVSCKADGLADATLRWYRSILSQFVTACDYEISSVQAADIRSYIVGLRERETYLDAPQRPPARRKLSQASVDSHVTALHAFWAWVAREYAIPNPMANIRRPPRRDPVVKAILPADFVKLFDSCGDDVAGVRNRALLSFLADTGCRLGGLVGLRLGDVDVYGGRAIVREKGGRVRKLYFTTVTGRFLLAWLAVRSSPSDRVFTSVVRSRGGLTASGVAQMLERLKAKAGVEGRVNPHSFRHAFAREYLLNGGDIVTLARRLGHSDVNTTAAYYAVFSQDELSELHERYSPLKGMMK